uniref:G-protein coupled receptors family 2 profile 1 domain-containing protein n=1 Tax=Chrysemys picta bellii TaxID=8478 RepID=A0A8C3IHV9_CHRPI
LFNQVCHYGYLHIFWSLFQHVVLFQNISWICFYCYDSVCGKADSLKTESSLYFLRHSNHEDIWGEILGPLKSKVLGSLLAKTTTKWLNYKNDCLKTLQESAVETGIYCKGTFDQLVCWPYSLPGNVSVPCPSYLPWLENGNVISLFLKDSYQESSLQEGVVSAGSTVLELPGGLLGPILHHLLPG